MLDVEAQRARGAASHFAADTWAEAALGELVQDVASGDWGADAPSAQLMACRVLRGTDFAAATRGDVSSAPMRYLKTASIAKRQVVAGDLLVELSGGSKDQPTGRLLLISDELVRNQTTTLVFSNFVKRIRVDRQTVDPEYFAYYWERLYRDGSTRTYEKRTTGIRNFKLADFLANESIALPPLPEQRAIAQVLRTVQRAREATEAVIAAARELKRSLMRHLFRYGAVVVGDADETELVQLDHGGFPARWEFRRLEQLAEVVRGGSPRPKGDPRYFAKAPTPYHWIMISDLARYKRGKYLTNTLEHLTEAGSKRSRHLRSGELVLTNSGTVGIPAILGIHGCIHDGYLAFLNMHSALDKEYLYHFFESVTGYLRAIAPTGTQANLNTNIMKALTIAIPPLEEQRAIVADLAAADAKLQAEQARAQALVLLSRVLMTELLSGRIRVAQVIAPQAAGTSRQLSG